jgi:hypothetical protein
MKLAKEKVDLSWLHKPEYEVLLEIWQKTEPRHHTPHWVSREEEYGFRRICYTDKGRGTSTQYVRLTVRQWDRMLLVDVNNPNTGCNSEALLPFDDLIPSPRQFQKLVFAKARGDKNTLSASKTNLRLTWKEFLEATEKMPVIEHSELHIDNSDEGWLE